MASIIILTVHRVSFSREGLLSCDLPVHQKHLEKALWSVPPERGRSKAEVKSLQFVFCMPPVEKTVDSFCAWMSWGKHSRVESVKLNNTQAVRYCLKVFTAISPVVCSRCIAMRISPGFDGHLQYACMLRDWVSQDRFRHFGGNFGGNSTPKILFSKARRVHPEA